MIAFCLDLCALSILYRMVVEDRLFVDQDFVSAYEKMIGLAFDPVSLRVRIVLLISEMACVKASCFVPLNSCLLCYCTRMKAV